LIAYKRAGTARRTLFLAAYNKCKIKKKQSANKQREGKRKEGKKLFLLN
jgi:hypothetical protein